MREKPAVRRCRPACRAEHAPEHGSASVWLRQCAPSLWSTPLQATPHTGPALIAAPWPAADAAVDAATAAQFEALQAAVRAVRNARAEYGVDLGRKIAATVRCVCWSGLGGVPGRRRPAACGEQGCVPPAAGHCQH